MAKKKKYELNRRMNLIVHTKKLSKNIDDEQKITGNDYTVILNRRLNESYETNPIEITQKP